MCKKNDESKGNLCIITIHEDCRGHPRVLNVFRLTT